MRRPIAVAVVLVHLLFLIGPLDVLAPVDPHLIGRKILTGQLPYQDFQFEYPPLAAIVFVLPGLVPSALGLNALALQAVALQVLLAHLVLRHHDGALVRYGLLSLFLFPFLSGGFDIVVVLSVALATHMLARDDRRGWWVAALGAAAKVGSATVWVWSRSKLRTGVLAGAVGAAVTLSPMLLVGLRRDSWVGYSVDRGVQAESVAASASWVWRELTGASIDYAYRFRAWELVGAEHSGSIMLGISLVGFVAIAWRARVSVDPWLLSYAAVLLLLAGSKVLSPQFMAWPAPMAAVLGRRWFTAHLVLSLLTVAVFMGPSELLELSPLIAVRNGLLVATAVAAVVAVWRRGGDDASRSQPVDIVTP